VNEYDRQKFTDTKIVTHGINFDVTNQRSDQSMGTLNMIAQILKDNPDLKFDVEGFTDNSGNLHITSVYPRIAQML
jgi:outer membrane protein OmpA-like peptidoglycan-associated protein